MSGPISCTVQACRMAVSVLIVVTYSSSSLAAGEPAAKGKGPPQTVTWYADHQRERARVQLACLDNPGRLRADPDCINAHSASVTVAARQARLHDGELDQNKVQAWIDDPETRRNHLIRCHLNPKLDNCDVARRSLLVEAGLVRR